MKFVNARQPPDKVIMALGLIHKSQAEQVSFINTFLHIKRNAMIKQEWFYRLHKLI